MKKLWWVSIVVCVACFGLTSISFAAQEGDFAESSRTIADKLSEYFPTVQGTIVSVQDAVVFIDIGLEHNLIAGAQLAILQEGVEIVHPTTNKVLGTYEKQIGNVQITEVREQFSVAKILWQDPEHNIVQGLKIGGFPGNVKLAILPVHSLSDQAIPPSLIYESFASELKQHERFTIFDEADMKAAALKAGIAPEEGISLKNFSAINTILHAHNFLQLELHPDGENLLLQATMLTDTGEEIGSAQEIVREYAAVLQQESPLPQVADSPEKTPKPAEESIPTPEPEPVETIQESKVVQSQIVQEQIWNSDIFKMKAHKLAVGDLMGEGKNQLVLADQHDLYILESGVLGEKQSFLTLGNISGASQELILSLDIGDINHNGNAEIFVSFLRGRNAGVRVYEYVNGKFDEIWSKMGVIMRVIRMHTGAVHLVGQRTSSSLNSDFLVGDVDEYNWNGNDYIRQGALNLPKWLDIFGFTVTDLMKDGGMQIVAYTNQDRIEVRRGKQQIWRSAERYEPYKIYVARKGEQEDKVKNRFSGKIELVEAGSEKNIYLALFQNFRPFKFVTGLPSYNDSMFHIFQWNGKAFKQTFESERYDAYTVDYVIGDVDNDGRQEIALAMVLRGDSYFKTPQSHLLIYELEYN